MERGGVSEVWVKDLKQMRPVAEFLDGVQLDRSRTREDPRELQPPPSSASPEVYISYAWKGESPEVQEKIVTALAARLKTEGITLKWDKNELTYRDAIREFMQRLGRGQAVIVVLSKAYLESSNCMFELTEIAKREAKLNQVFPIVLEDAGIFDMKTRLGYIKHWETEKKELETEMKEVGSENLQGVREALDLYVTIRNEIAKIVDVIGNMLAYTSNAHEEEGFERLFRAIVAKVKDSA